MYVRHSHERKERDDALDPFQRLADIFKSREGGDFQKYNWEEDEEEVSDVVQSHLQGINPNKLLGSRPLRDGVWVEKK